MPPSAPPPRPRGRPALPEEDLRGKVVQAATQILLSQGYAAATMEAVARQANVAKKTVYRFAANREELIALILRDWTAPFPLAFEAEAADAGAALRVLEDSLILIAGRVLTAEAVGLFRLLVNDLPEREAVLEIYTAAGIDRSRALLAGWLSRHRARGVITCPDPALAADLILSMVIAEPLRQIAIRLTPPQPEWDIRPRVQAALSLLRLTAGAAP
ncbi:TetR/AcrR family transcriptional regulator [Novispirillum itersonii]|uniref:AcrR family transcriptional regulator n=1 Tax=Novispirillum itersonii TaxID=189 RepID=A0A7W9ZFK0_NOVIT|nr:TetR/AcrR family transcriptional regulator [Novispirillum itersonii]MBB6210320.1 AcrR family transcriptional regulator [Novispirillum itersonii]